MTSKLERNYGRWETPHVRWESVAAFCAEDAWDDGVHTIELGTGPSLDLIISGQPFNGRSTALPVFFSGAVQSRETKAGPFFSGEGISRSGGFPYVSISDPSLELHETLGLAWYTGSEGQPLRDPLLAVLRAVADAYGNELLLIGGSGGGYTALFYGQKLGERASVFVWNAQTDILEYNEKFVRHYLETAFPDRTSPLLQSADWKSLVRQELSDAGVELSVLPDASAGLRPRRTVFIQNATDWHVPVHTAPFLSAGNYKHLGRGMYQRGVNQAVWITHFGSDHEALPAASVSSLVKDLLDPARTAREVVSSFKDSGLVPGQRPGTEPRDLRHLKAELAGQLSLDLQEEPGGGVQARVNLGSIPVGYGGLRFGFFKLRAEGAATNEKWYSADPEYTFSKTDPESNYSVQVRVRDGFNHELFSLEAAAPAPVQHPSRVFIYGSCVTRDAFALEHDFELVDYVARSPFGSAFAQPPKAVDVKIDSIPSAFQRRMVRTDLHKQLDGLLRDKDFDYLLVDLIDERIRLMPYEDTVIAYSAELQRTGLQVDFGKLLGVGSEEYYALWKQGLDRLLAACPASKIVVNRVFWATAADDGTELPDQAGIARHNEVLKRLYAELSAHPEIRFIDYPEGLLVANSKHQWGAAPFHFVEGVSMHLLGELAKLSPQGA